MILLRHGQSEFNLRFAATRRDPGIADPALTRLGHVQALRASIALRGEGITRIISSPYTRALQTARPIARALGLPVHVNPLVRERCAFSCDIGTPRAALAAAWPEHDFAGMDEIWWPAIEEPIGQLVARAALFRAEIAALPDWSQTLVVCHWGFVMAMTGEQVGNGEWRRCDPSAAAPAWRS